MFVKPLLGILAVLGLLVEPSLGTLTKVKKGGSKREGKVFSLFNIVSFKNEACQSTNTNTGGTGGFRNGTCYTSSECASKGGSISGSCASGFGVCCLFVITDATITAKQNCTYIQNPGFPTTLSTATALQYTIAKSDPTVCNLRLDFESFTLIGPTGTIETSGGLCASDTFTVTTGTGQRIPTICGQNSGQHMYIDVGAASSDSVTIAFTFTGTNNLRVWDIKVTQIPCAASYAPPDGCLQYLTGLTGRFTSFNFLDATGSSHLASQQYTICIRQEPGFCCTQYQVCPDANSFSIDNSRVTGVAATGMLAAGSTSLSDSSCSTDYVTISGSSSVCDTASGSNIFKKFCGEFLNPVTIATMTPPAPNALVCDCTPPFEVGIVTDNLADASTVTNGAVTPPLAGVGSNGAINRGVCLLYNQVPCS